MPVRSGGCKQPAAGPAGSADRPAGTGAGAERLFCNAIFRVAARWWFIRSRWGDKVLEQSVVAPRRTWFVDALDSAIRQARKAGWAERPQLERDALMAGAAEYTGLGDFGDRWFVEPFDKLLESVRGEARLNALGEWAAAKQFEKILHDRLWAEQWFARHPEILARPLPHPVIVVGPMRSGTTRMHRLLSADRRFSHMRSFETISPVPRPDFAFGGKDSRVVLARRITRLARLANPRTLTIHPTGPMEAEEELGLLVNSFWSLKHDSQWWVPGAGRLTRHSAGAEASSAWAWPA